MTRYIKNIRLENFQSYKDQTIEFKPGLNLILGSSDSGKSAILRAISFVLYNTPRSKTLIHHGATEVRVTIEYSDGTIITRIRGDRNAVMISLPSGDIKTWDKIDTELPEEVKKAMGFPPIDDINGTIAYADQFAKMFLVDLSPTDLPRSLSSLTGVELLEHSAKELMQNYKTLEKQVKADEKTLTKLLDEQQSFDFIDEIEKRLKSTNATITSLDMLQNNIEILSKYIVDIDLSVDESNLIYFNEILSKIGSTFVKLKNIKKKTDELDKLKIFNLVIEHHEQEYLIPEINELLTNLDNQSKNILAQKNINNNINLLISFENQYLNVKSQGNKLSTEYKNTQSELLHKEDELKKFKQMLIDEKIQCEVCGSIL